MLKSFLKEEVVIEKGLFRERIDLNLKYLLELSTDALLQNYELEAGIVLPGLQSLKEPENAWLHWGWEAPICQLRGHFLGHWMSAASAMIANEGNRELKAKLDEVIDRLEVCQIRNGGKWLAPVPEKYFAFLIRNEYVWSPQYVMHKLMMGLLDTFLYTGNEKALKMLNNLADWYLDWTELAMRENPDAIYSGEQAGMLEIWARLAELTGAEKYWILVRRYENNRMFEKLDRKEDALTDDHANASIPLSHGAASMYALTGEEIWKSRCEEFWEQAVTRRGYFATGGMNAGEFWVAPHTQGGHLGDRNQEFCTVYNMVRTAREMYLLSGERRYADYIERCLYNGFLAQQSPSTGMPAYFLPMTSGAVKKWGTRTRDFWCCHGTMIQAQTIYPDLIYFLSKEGETESTTRLWISQYIPSTLASNIDGTKFKLCQQTNLKSYNSQTLFDEHGTEGSISRWSRRFDIKFETPSELILSFRRPVWCTEDPDISVTSRDIRASEGFDICERDGYINVRGTWSDECIILTLPACIIAERLPDEEEKAAFLDGPIVLAGITDQNAIKGDFNAPDGFLRGRVEHTYETFTWSQNRYETGFQDKNFRLIPLYEVDEQRYTIYFSEMQ